MNKIKNNIGPNVLKKYGQYKKRVNGELIQVRYEWFERDDHHDKNNRSSAREKTSAKHFRLQISKTRFEKCTNQLAHFRELKFEELIELLTPMITSYSNADQLYQIFQILDCDNDNYLNEQELEQFLIIIDRSESISKIESIISQLTSQKKLTFENFKQFVTDGLARELLMEEFNMTDETQQDRHLSFE